MGASLRIPLEDIASRGVTHNKDKVRTKRFKILGVPSAMRCLRLTLFVALPLAIYCKFVAQYNDGDMEANNQEVNSEGDQTDPVSGIVQDVIDYPDDGIETANREERDGQSGCQTISGSQPYKDCIFPFIFDQKQFNECTTYGMSAPWCSTKTDNNTHKHVGGQGNWGYCAEQCPGGPYSSNETRCGTKTPSDQCPNASPCAPDCTPTCEIDPNRDYCTCPCKTIYVDTSKSPDKDIHWITGLYNETSEWDNATAFKYFNEQYSINLFLFRCGNCSKPNWRIDLELGPHMHANGRELHGYIKEIADSPTSPGCPTMVKRWAQVYTYALDSTINVTCLPDPCNGIKCTVPDETCVNGTCMCGNATSCNTAINTNMTASVCDAANNVCKCGSEDLCIEGKRCRCELCSEVDCTWTEWERGNCSTICGVGTRNDTRTKSVVESQGGKCVGENSRKEPCYEMACCVGNAKSPVNSTVSLKGDGTIRGSCANETHVCQADGTCGSGDSTAPTPQPPPPLPPNEVIATTEHAE